MVIKSPELTQIMIIQGKLCHIFMSPDITSGFTVSFLFQRPGSIIELRDELFLSQKESIVFLKHFVRVLNLS
jgi:hypothetical protein